MYNFLGNHHREALWYTKNMTKPKHILTNILRMPWLLKHIVRRHAISAHVVNWQ